MGLKSGCDNSSTGELLARAAWPRLPSKRARASVAAAPPAHTQGDANNAILAAAGYNFRRLICWLRLLLRQILSALLAEPQSSLKSGFFTDDEIATNWVKRP
jgi:hypothetical protein